MVHEHDTVVKAAIVEAGFAAPEPPLWAAIEAAAARSARSAPGRLMPGWATAVLAGVLLLILVGGPAWLLSQRGGDAGPGVGDEPPLPTITLPPATTPSTSTVTTTGSPSTTTAPPSTTTTTGLPGGLAVRVEGEIVFGWDEPNVWDTAPFQASGPAVDAGLICDEGTMDLWMYDQGIGTWRSEVRYTCADGSGTFHLRFELSASYAGGEYSERGEWTVVFANGRFEGITGAGSDVATLASPGHYITVQEGFITPGG